MRMTKWMGLAFTALALQPALADTAPTDPSRLPLLIIGASYAEGKTPFNNGIAPLGGVSVGLGSYLSVGQALTRSPLLPGYVINEGQAGGTTFARSACAPGASTCGPATWDSYATQLQKALARVAVPPSFNTYNARYVVILTPNDCLHADAFGVPQSTTQPCTAAQMNQVADRLIAVGNQARAAGLTPIFDVMPRYKQLDLPLFRSLYGLAWVISEADYNTLRTVTSSRVRSEVPGAVVLDIWKDFVHIGDGIHPTPETARKAARTIGIELLQRDHAH
ncbi:MAG: SGNH/GDSL hydrolase family protein [Aquabacterium sp.]|uniref:SGNH/GDSL hydrolase family protein n=1 Tax=Aquabacterium sp. TaxID=1872578 RepID=UPI0025B92003|nr:hypothetical protein [Aquabacterium sp.]MBI3380958.1 SGNH/GDSL hydrolase family protein [Aquabacterium sp.]